MRATIGLCLITLALLPSCSPCVRTSDVQQCVASVLSIGVQPAMGVAGAVNYCGAWHKARVECAPAPIATDAGVVVPMPAIDAGSD